MMKPFVAEGSIVRKIWGKSETILFIFAGAAAEFALNKAVDWLYFTGRLPSDPIGRLFSTVSYSRQIVFSEEAMAVKAIAKISAIHRAVEESRGEKIPGSAYRDVLFILIDYSIRSFGILDRALRDGEKEEIFDVFYRIGLQMNIPDLPKTYKHWLSIREEQLRQNLVFSKHTVDLHLQYKKHLGANRYYLMRQVQSILLPQQVKEIILPEQKPLIHFLIPLYKLSRFLKTDKLLMKIILPGKYCSQIMSLNIQPGQIAKKCPFIDERTLIS